MISIDNEPGGLVVKALAWFVKDMGSSPTWFQFFSVKSCRCLKRQDSHVMILMIINVIVNANFMFTESEVKVLKYDVSVYLSIYLSIYIYIYIYICVCVCVCVCLSTLAIM